MLAPHPLLLLQLLRPPQPLLLDQDWLLEVELLLDMDWLLELVLLLDVAWLLELVLLPDQDLPLEQEGQLAMELPQPSTLWIMLVRFTLLLSPTFMT